MLGIGVDATRRSFEAGLQTEKSASDTDYDDDGGVWWGRISCGSVHESVHVPGFRCTNEKTLTCKKQTTHPIVVPYFFE